MSLYLTSRMASLPPYVPGAYSDSVNALRLNTNESPYPPSEGVARAVAAKISGLCVYNDPDCVKLRRAIAAHCGVQEDNVMAGNGSDQVLYLAIMAFADEDRPVVLPDVTYDYYEDFAAALGVPVERKPLRKDYTLDPADYMEKGKMPVFPNPNAPTGLSISLDEIESIAHADERRVVVVDEAYGAFGSKSAVSLLGKCPNLLVTRTFSKSGSLAGARLGYALGSRELIEELSRVRSSVDLYGVSSMAQAAGIAACEEWAYYEANCRRIMEARTWTQERLTQLGFLVLPSSANFVFARPPMNTEEMYHGLERRGILVRYWNKPRTKDWLRISIGTQQDMERLTSAAAEILEGAAK